MFSSSSYIKLITLFCVPDITSSLFILLHLQVDLMINYPLSLSEGKVKLFTGYTLYTQGFHFRVLMKC